MNSWSQLPELLVTIGERIRPRVGDSFSLVLGEPASSQLLRRRERAWGMRYPEPLREVYGAARTMRMEWFLTSDAIKERPSMFASTDRGWCDLDYRRGLRMGYVGDADPRIIFASGKFEVSLFLVDPSNGAVYMRPAILERGAPRLVAESLESLFDVWTRIGCVRPSFAQLRPFWRPNGTALARTGEKVERWREWMGLA